MAEAKQILVIDDHFEMLEFLRSMLDVSGEDYEVLAVPSAEEGLLELRRAHFDLLISDVRLPGMSGFELLRRMRKLGRDIPAIMITAYASPQGEKEAEELGVYRYFKKPLDTDSMLTAVHQALYGEDVPMENTAVATPEAGIVDIDLSDEVRKRLDMLRADTGATDLILTTRGGQILHNIGDNQGLNMERLAAILTRTIADSFLLADELKAKKPFTLQYHTGGHTELYCANIGNSYYLTIFFDARSRRGRIGTIWVFAQRAINDLMSMLPDLPSGVATAPPPPVSVAPREQPQPPAISPTRIKGDRKKREPIPKRQPRKIEEEKVVPDWALEIPDEPEPEEKVVEADYIDIDPDELAKLLSEGELPVDDAGDLESFWDDAMDETLDEESASKGMSFEEAMQQGLISLDDNE